MIQACWSLLHRIIGTCIHDYIAIAPKLLYTHQCVAKEILTSIALGLRKPIYRKTAAYGHFGRDDIEFPWEQTDKAEALKQAAGL